MSYTSAFRGNNIDSILSVSAATGWVEELVLEAKRATLDAAYPIGSVYMSFSTTDPGTLFGGTWERIVGYYLYCVELNNEGNVGNIFGSNNHFHSTGDCTLSIAQMPTHRHSLGSTRTDLATENPFSLDILDEKGWTSNYRLNSNMCADTGGSQPHNHGNTSYANNYPPSIRVMAWRRIS